MDITCLRQRTVASSAAAALALLVVVATDFAAPAQAMPAGTVRVPSTLETEPTGVAGDTADDPAIWVNTADPAQSLVITNEKRVGRLTVFDLAGRVVQRITNPPGFYGNVDVRGSVVAASHSGILVWRVMATTDGPRLVPSQEATGNARTNGRVSACTTQARQGWAEACT